MPDKKILRNLILDHLNEPENDFFYAKLNSIRKESSSNELYYQEIKRIWDAAEDTKILASINKDNSVNIFKAKLKDQVILKPSRSYRWLISVAAAATFLIASYWFYSSNVAGSDLYKETLSQADSLYLSDGSKIMLAENTMIKYPASFDGATREITLVKGKAFFKVFKDSKHPFQIAIGRSKVVVLGTSFNIKYSDSLIDLAVTTGKVRFTPNEVSTGAVLLAGETVSYNFITQTIDRPDGINATAWLTKELHFVDMPLSEVCSQLSDYYKVNISLHDTVRTAKKFNAHFKGSSLTEVLNVLKATYSIEIENKGDTATIKSLK